MLTCYFWEHWPCLHEIWAQLALALSTQLGPLLRVMSTVENWQSTKLWSFTATFRPKSNIPVCCEAPCKYTRKTFEPLNQEVKTCKTSIKQNLTAIQNCSNQVMSQDLICILDSHHKALEFSIFNYTAHMCQILKHVKLEHYTSDFC